MITNGFLVALGLLVILAKLPWRSKLWCTSHPLLIDLMVFVLLTLLHWGTFSGVMVATIAAFFCSVVLSLARRTIGHVKDGLYFRGFFDVIDKLQ